ncbi:MAG: GMC family oxidoreductase N-terminal domain-containing protein [Rhodospirillales bacterium]|nr:GMC family oxidoreductase N-terminal domain-containing protein [Rhodospirillales bacterium]
MPQAPAEESLGHFDYVIVGAGSAGCVLANRLSADGRRRIAILEAGGNDDWIWFHVPVGYLYAMGSPRADWCYKTEAETGLNGRSLNYPRGKVIGGCSAINGMIYMRGQSSDYDGWRQLGNVGWAWDDVLPYFRKSEDQARGADALHGAGGDLRVEDMRLSWEVLNRFRDAAAENGIPRVEDFNRGSNEGCGYFQVNQWRGRRVSMAGAFLKPALKRRNLQLFTQAQALELSFDGKRVTGLLLGYHGKTVRIEAAGGVLLAAGAINSPQLLMLSGIGAGAELARQAIPLRHELSGVGSNLQDHLQLRLIYRVSGLPTLNTQIDSPLAKAGMVLRYALYRRGPMTMAPSQLGAFTRSGPAYAMPNLEYHVQPLSLDSFGEPLHSFDAFTASVCNLRPLSRGRVSLASADPYRPPAIAPNYLSDPADRAVAADAIRLTRRIVLESEAFRPHRPEEYLPGPAFRSEAELIHAAGNIGTTIFHPVGTCRMGQREGAVVDARLRVHGLEGLRVIDASVMPAITSGNTNAPTVMIAEKAADMIAEDEAAHRAA